jgi:hypothetical protein
MSNCADKPQILNLNDENEPCGCFSARCAGSGCKLKFKYVNVNAIQDDVFELTVIVTDCEGTETKTNIGTINGRCDAYYINPETGEQSECQCTKVDERTLEWELSLQNIKDFDICESCKIEVEIKQVGDNECGTFATFDVIGPCGPGFEGTMAQGTFQIDLYKACFECKNFLTY